MRIFLASGIFCLPVLLGLSALASSPERKPQPEVFLITIDTLRADHVHCYGYNRVETPGIDGLAKDGIRFAQAFTPSPITNSSHASILTGLLPTSHGVTDFGVPLSPAHPTIAELLKERGYRTAAFIGAVILDSKVLAPGFDRGFDFYDNFPEHLTKDPHWGRVERRGMDVVRRAEAWLDQHPVGSHFLWIHLYDPHDPYEPPEPYARAYKDHLYDGEIAYADSALVNFVGYLNKTKRFHNSIVIVVGDHGEGLGEHGEDTHGIFLYDSTTHVPLIIKLPGERNAGQVIDSQVSTVDIAPTILELVGAAPIENSDGQSLRSYFEGTNKTERPAFGETDYPLRFGWSPLRSVRSEGFKYIEAPRPEFYDLRSDAGELHNQYEPWNEQVRKQRTLVAELRTKEARVQSKGVLAPGTLDELRALGYLGSADAGSATTAAAPSMLPDPKDKIAEQNLLHAAMVAVEDNRVGEARKSLEQVLVLDPGAPTALRQLGELELKTGQYDRAAQHLKSALVARPDDAMAAFYEGQADEHLHDHVSARDALKASLKISAGQIPAHLLLGRVYLELKNPDRAEDQFEIALLLQPDCSAARLGIARAEIAAGNFSQAARNLQILARTQPRNPEVFECLAEAYTGLGRGAEATQAKARATVLRGPVAN